MKKDINYWVTRLITALLVLSMFCVGITMFTYNIAYERLHMDNPVISFFIRAMDLHSRTVAENAGIKTDATVEIDFEKLYPFQENPAISVPAVTEASFMVSPAYQKLSESYSATILKLRQVFNDYASVNLPLYSEIFKISEKIKNVIFYNTINDQPFCPMVSSLSSKDIKSITDNITALHQFLSSQKIPLLYVNAPSKVAPATKNIDDFSNANANVLLPQLSQNGISTFDFRTAIASEKRDHADMYYIGEHHWKTSTALWAAGTLADILNEKYGFHFDKKYFETESYSIENCQNIFLSNKNLNIIEDYEAILPLYPTNFKVDIPSKDYHMSGSYADILFRQDLLNTLKKASREELHTLPSVYACSRLTNELALAHIENLNPTNNADKKILYIGDSYGWYLVPYLAADIQYLDFLHLKTFTGSLETYIKQTQPDIVIILNYPGIIEAPTAEELENHTAFFDFR